MLVQLKGRLICKAFSFRPCPGALEEVSGSLRIGFGLTRPVLQVAEGSSNRTSNPLVLTDLTGFVIAPNLNVCIFLSPVLNLILI